MITAESIVARFKHEEMLKRIVATYKQALDIGRTVFTPNSLKIHRYRDHIQVTDMTNAGKRGKKVLEFTVIPTAYQTEMADVTLNNFGDAILHMNYGQAKAHAEHVLAESAKMGETPFNLNERAMRGVDVEPMGTPINVSKTFPDGTIVEIMATPHGFRVKNSVVINAPNKPAHGFRQDTNYWARKREDGIVFYAWAKENISKLGNMTIQDLMKVWDHLNVKYDSH